MLKRTSTGLAAVFLLLLATVPPMTTRAGAEEEPLLIIVGPDFLAKDVPFSSLKEAFKGRAALVDGKRLVPINHPLESSQRIAFDRLVLRLKPIEVGRFWIDARIRDDLRPPTMAGTGELAVRIVASLPYSISYATRSMLSSKVKVLTVDGKAAGDPGYALKP